MTLIGAHKVRLINGTLGGMLIKVTIAEWAITWWTIPPRKRMAQLCKCLLGNFAGLNSLRVMGLLQSKTGGRKQSLVWGNSLEKCEATSADIFQRERYQYISSQRWDDLLAFDLFSTRRRQTGTASGMVGGRQARLCAITKRVLFVKKSLAHIQSNKYTNKTKQTWSVQF